MSNPYDNSVLFFHNFLTKEECAPFIELYKKHQPNPTDNFNWIYLKDNPITKKVQNYLSEMLGVSFTGVVTGIGVWLDNKGGTAPHKHSPDLRPLNDFTSLIYLNDDFEGGEFFTPSIKFKPEVGTLTFFNGMKIMHGAMNQTGSDRYYLIFWWEGTTK